MRYEERSKVPHAVTGSEGIYSAFLNIRGAISYQKDTSCQELEDETRRIDHENKSTDDDKSARPRSRSPRVQLQVRSYPGTWVHLADEKVR